MKIAIFHTTLPEKHRKIGGVEVFCHRLANNFCLQGHEVVVYSLTPCPEDAIYQHTQLFKNFPALVRVKLLRLFVLPLMLNFVKWQDHDILHLHGDDWFFVNRKMPTIRTLHGSAKFEAKSATSLKRKIIQSIVYPLEHISARLADRVAGIGIEAYRLYNADFVSDIGIDTSLFKSSGKNASPLILFVGTLTGRKRGGLVQDIFINEIYPKYPEARLAMVCDLQPHDHPGIEWFKQPSDTELAELYKRSWIFFYPSTYEGFGIPYIESLASRSVIVCSENSGANYVLDNGQYGFIVEDEALGTTVIELLSNPELRDEYMDKGAKYVEKFSWENVCLAHRNMYESAIKKKNNEGKQ